MRKKKRSRYVDKSQGFTPLKYSAYVNNVQLSSFNNLRVQGSAINYFYNFLVVPLKTTIPCENQW